MPLTKAQIEKGLELFERFVEAHEAIAEAAVMMTTPEIKLEAATASRPLPAAEAVEEAPNTTASSEGGSSGLDLGLDLGDDDEASTAGTEDDNAEPELTQESSDVPVDAGESTLDLSDPKAVEEFRAQVINVLKEYAAECKDTPTAVPDLLEEVCNTRKLSEVADEQLEELHDSVFDAIAQLQ